MEIRSFFARAERLDMARLRRERPDWTDSLPVLFKRPSVSQKPLVKRYWSYWLPISFIECYDIWRARRRHERNLEQIEIDELNEICEQDDNSKEALAPIYEKHAERRLASRFTVVSKERFRLERLARRWDVDCPKLIHKGEADEAALTQVRRCVNAARWTFYERIAKTLIPVLSLLIALIALLTR